MRFTLMGQTSVSKQCRSKLNIKAISDQGLHHFPLIQQFLDTRDQQVANWICSNFKKMYGNELTFNILWASSADDTLIFS